MSRARVSPQHSDPDADIAHAIGSLLIVVIPLIALWFFNFAQSHYDFEFEQLLVSKAEQGSEQAAAAHAILETQSVSAIMSHSGPELDQIKTLLEPLVFRYTIFKWMNMIAVGCLVAAILAFVPIGICVFLAQRSEHAFYYSLLIGWGSMRLLIPLQLLGQSILLGALSFWIPGIIFGRAYWFIVGGVSGLGLYALRDFIRGLFTKQNEEPLDARVTKERQAPALWQRVKQMADYLGTAPPDQIIAGVESQFFVTEAPLEVEANTLTGRTLYLSIPMLKQLTIDEADAILAHEMAHFCGRDTYHSARTGPLLLNFATTLQSMDHQSIVTKFMSAFWRFFLHRNQTMNREREFRADAVAARTVAPLSLLRALIKVTAYAHWRSQLERRLLSTHSPDVQLDIQTQLESGFPSFLARFASKPKAGIEIPHPFDSHPPMDQRATKTGLDIRHVMQDPTLRQPPASSWITFIPNAERIEAQYWTTLETDMQNSHREQLAMEYRPSGKEEKEIVQEVFPELTYKKGSTRTAQLTYRKLLLSHWKGPIFFEDIEGYVIEAGIPYRVLKIGWNDSGKSKVAKFCPSEYTGHDLALIEAFEKYYARHLFAHSLAKQKRVA